MTALENLKQYFGYDAFRTGQETLINDILAGKDVLGIMPTGAGKSVCFQIPALMMNGLTLIISPLISLMKDQVNALTQSGIAAAFINSSLTDRQINKALYNAANGAYKLIYVAPERLFSYDFMEFARYTEISMLTVDEAHCISQWGQDFRPSYARIPEFIAQLKKRPVVSAFTATATQRVREDIVDLLALRTPTVLVSGFDRQNLYFDVKKPKDKFLALTGFLKDKKDRYGIVYCSTRAAVEEVCDRLKQSGYNASRYHAGLTDIERHSNQEDFLYDRVNIMVATNAFGMGIDKSNVSFVVHYNMPKDIESYYQEAGRAGRDGEPADCILLYSGQDVHTILWLIENSSDTQYPDKATEKRIKERELQRLREMTWYCSTNDCFRGFILKYFGENPPDNCGACGNCGENLETVDVTLEAQQILSCVAGIKERFGINMIIDVLRGGKTGKIFDLGLDKLPVYGISEKSDSHIRRIINHMILSEYLLKTADEYPVIKLGRRAGEVLRDGGSVYMKMPKEIKELREKSRRQTAVKSLDKRLLAHLKELRQKIADEQRVPAYTVLHDSSLTDMCLKLPATPNEFLDVSGVGAVKLEQYGKRFMEAIADFSRNNINSDDKQEIKAFDVSEIEISEDFVNVSVLADRINCVLIEGGYGKITGQKINDWLISKNFMTLVQKNKNSFKIPTETGAELGIIVEERLIRGENVNVNYFKPEAQKYIALNSLDILKS